MDILRRKVIVEQKIQRNETVRNWINDLESPLEQLGAWKLFRFLCEYYPPLRGDVIFESRQED